MATTFWRQHPGGLWHAFRPEEKSRVSVCGYTRSPRCGDPQAAVPEEAYPCRVCWYRLHGNWQGRKRPQVEHMAPETPAVEWLAVEIVEGHCDGLRVRLQVVWTSPTTFEVLPCAYEWRKHEKEQPPVEDGEEWKRGR